MACLFLLKACKTNSITIILHQTPPTGIQWGATLGFARLPDLRGRLGQDIFGTGTKTDLLGNKTTDTDYGSQGPIAGFNMDYNKTKNLGNGVNLFMNNKLDILAYVPIDTDPIIKKLNGHNTNGAFPYSDIGEIMGMSTIDFSSEFGLKYKGDLGN